MENNIKPIEAGKKVSEFIQALNDNFDQITDLKNHNNITRTITISQSNPNGGKDGDIWIVYEID